MFNVFLSINSVARYTDTRRVFYMSCVNVQQQDNDENSAKLEDWNGIPKERYPR